MPSLHLYGGLSAAAWEAIAFCGQSTLDHATGDDFSQDVSLHATKLGRRAAAQQRVDSSDEPNYEHQPATSQVPVARCLQYATGRLPGTSGKAKAHARYSQQVGATTACAQLRKPSYHWPCVRQSAIFFLRGRPQACVGI